MPKRTPYAALPAFLTISDMHPGGEMVGRCFGTVWSRPGSALDVPVLMVADTPENRAALASAGLLVQARDASEVAA